MNIYIKHSVTILDLHFLPVTDNAKATDEYTDKVDYSEWFSTVVSWF